MRLNARGVCGGLDQLSTQGSASAAASAASFARSALQMYLGLRGANLALAFLAWALRSCLIFFWRFIEWSGYVGLMTQTPSYPAQCKVGDGKRCTALLLEP